MIEKYNALKLSSQLCFPLYACSKEVVKLYKPYLDRIDLTYTQYITMMLMWENGCMRVKEIGDCLYLDSGTLTPVLKKLEDKGFVERKRSDSDKRDLFVTLTEKGAQLRETALSVPSEMSKCINIGQEKSQQLYSLLYELLNTLRKSSTF